MKTQLPDDVLAFGKAARARFAALGSESFSAVQFALSAENDPSARAAVGAALEELGVFELDIRTSAEEWLAACELMRVAGSVALPYPIAERILAIGGSWLAVVDPRAPLIDHAELSAQWVAVSLTSAASSGESFSAAVVRDEQQRKLAPFVRSATLTPIEPVASAADVDRWLVLGAWRVLGTLETSLAQVTEHVQARVQFGKALAEFQAVRFALADAVVSVRGLDELSRYTAWRLMTADDVEPRPDAVARADALALRIYAADSARSVLRTCHQLLGAVGFCDEHDVSVLDRHVQSTTRVPMPAEQLVDLLIPSVADESFQTLFTTRMA